MSIGITLGIKLGGGKSDVGGGDGAVSIASTQEMIAYNATKFPALPFALPLPILSISASNFTFNANSVPSMIDRVMNAISTTKTQAASSGATNAQIKVQYDNALAGANFAPGDYLLASTSGNGMNSATDYPTQYNTNYAAIFPAHAGKMIWVSGSNGPDVWTQSLTWEYENVPEQFVVDLRRVFGMVANKPGAPSSLVESMRHGGMPPTATLGVAPFNLVDNISNNAAHLNDDGQREVSSDLILRVAAMGGGAPYLLGQEMLVPFGSTNGDVLGIVLFLGSVTTWSIVGGNADGIVSIDASGQILRTAASLSTFDGVRELFIRAENANGEHIGRVMLMDGQPATLHNAPTARCSAYLRRQIADYANLENCGNQITGVMRYRVPVPLTADLNFLINRAPAGYAPGNGSVLRMSSGAASGGVRLTLRDNAGNSILSWSGLQPGAPFVVSDWITLFFSLDNSVSGASVNSCRYVQNTGGAARVAVPGAALAMTVQTALPILGNWYLSNQPLVPVAGNEFDIDFVGIWKGYKDWSVKANRDLLFDEAGGRLPVGFPLNGNLSGNGLDPVYFMAGGCGEFAVGQNRVAGSRKQLRQPQLSKSLSVAYRTP